MSHRCAPERDCRVKVEEASVRFFLRKQSPFPLGSTTGRPEFVLRKPGGVKITAYKRQRVALGCWPQHLQELSHSSASAFSSCDHFFTASTVGGDWPRLSIMKCPPSQQADSHLNTPQSHLTFNQHSSSLIFIKLELGRRTAP